jgi:hypothetical protein
MEIAATSRDIVAGIGAESEVIREQTVKKL